MLPVMRVQLDDGDTFFGRRYKLWVALPPPTHGTTPRLTMPEASHLTLAELMDRAGTIAPKGEDMKLWQKVLHPVITSPGFVGPDTPCWLEDVRRLGEASKRGGTSRIRILSRLGEVVDYTCDRAHSIIDIIPVDIRKRLQNFDFRADGTSSKKYFGPRVHYATIKTVLNHMLAFLHLCTSFSFPEPLLKDLQLKSEEWGPDQVRVAFRNGHLPRMFTELSLENASAGGMTLLERHAMVAILQEKQGRLTTLGCSTANSRLAECAHGLRFFVAADICRQRQDSAFDAARQADASRTSPIIEGLTKRISYTRALETLKANSRSMKFEVESVNPRRCTIFADCHVFPWSTYSDLIPKWNKNMWRLFERLFEGKNGVLHLSPIAPLLVADTPPAL